MEKIFGVFNGEVKKEVPISAMPGDAVLFSSLILHRTKPNLSNIPRLAYVIEYMSTETYDPYLEAPYFMIAKGGVPAPGFENNYAARQNVFNRLKYAKDLKTTVKAILGPR